MPAIRGLEIVGDAFAMLNMYLVGETVPPEHAEYARRSLNDLLGEFGVRSQFIPTIAPTRFPMILGKGTRYNPYTIGIGGDFNVAKPSNQLSIQGANLILTTPGPPNETRVPLAPFTDDGWSALPLPDLAGTQPTGFYYNPTFANDLGSFSLWPVPNNTVNDLEFFLQVGVPPFANLQTLYYIPDAWPRMLKYNLASDLQTFAGRELPAPAARVASSTRKLIMRTNLNMTDVANDAMFSGGRSTGYNINSGQGG